jgi:uncharacterized protein
VRFEHSFTVTTDIETAWTALADFERIAVCIPGATVESVAGDEVHGSIKVRLGSIGPTYKGTMTFVQRDQDAHRIVLKAHAETRTAGSATAGVVASLTEFGGSTTVLIISDVEFTGKAGQLEASVVADAGNRLVRQFAQRLADLLAAAPTPVSPPVLEPATAAGPESEHSEPEPPPAEEPQMSQSQEPTPTPDRAADAEIGDESPPQVMPQRIPEASSASDGQSAPATAPSREPEHSSPPGGAPAAATQTVPPAAIAAVVVVLLLVIRRRRRKRKRR